MAVPDRVFREYLAAYVREVRTIQYTDIDSLQPDPYATLGHGGAGTAYALWRLGLTDRATAWIDGAASDQRRSAFRLEDAPRQPRASYLFGAGGVRWVRAMAEGPGAYASFARGLPHHGPLEFASGSAGLLIGALLLLRRAPHAALEARASQLARSLEVAARRRARREWRLTDATGFAHGWPGILYALLAWFEWRRAPVPAWLSDALARLARAWTPRLLANSPIRGSWCNGSAGATMLWVKAHLALGDPVFLRTARRSARHASHAVDLSASLCCGNIGIAFSLLTLDRIDPGRGWRARARVIAARTIREASFAWPNGLYQGHPGLVCLALDCLGDEPRGFPAIEG